MRLYIIRHADPDYENNTITPEGHLEAEALAKRLQREGINKIYSSPMGRAIDTAEHTAKLLGIDYNIEEWTEEIWDSLKIDGTPWGTIAAWDIPGEVIRGNDKIVPSYDMWSSIPYLDDKSDDIVETFEMIREHSDDFLARQGYRREGGKYACHRPNTDKVAVFCHGGFGITWLGHLLEIPLPLVWSAFWLPPSSVTTVLFDERSDSWAVPRCIGLGDVSHLYAAGLPVRPRGIKANFD